MKKTIVALVLALALIVPSFGMAAAYTAGTYEAEAQGFSSAVKVSVTVSESEITALTVDCSGDTPGIGAAAGEPMVEAILAAQSAEVDGVSGATMTSNAIKVAVQKALDDAAGAAAWDGTYTAGTYTAASKGKNGEITVEVVFSENAIESVTVTGHAETLGLGYGISTAPIDMYPAQIVEGQTLAVDAITNATVTANAVIAAVADTVAQAGGDAEVLRKSRTRRTTWTSWSWARALRASPRLWRLRKPARTCWCLKRAA